VSSRSAESALAKSNCDGDHSRSISYDRVRYRNGQDAYDKARKSLHDTGQPRIVNEIIAQCMIALAEKGERDPDRLCAGALVALGNNAVFEK
jgi:hypothetical protein